MRIGLTLQNYNRILRNLRSAGLEIKEDFKGDLIKQGANIRDRAKDVLIERSKQRTNQRYWTGALHNAIFSRPTVREDNIVGISVGVDERQAPYAEWVEIGHYLVAGDFGSQRGMWWEGYHFMETAFAEIAPQIPNQISNTVKIKLNKFDQGRQTRHRDTGRFVKGFRIQD